MATQVEKPLHLLRSALLVLMVDHLPANVQRRAVLQHLGAPHAAVHCVFAAVVGLAVQIRQRRRHSSHFNIKNEQNCTLIFQNVAGR